MGDARQAKELAMSPKTRAVYKDFSHKLRSKDTQSKGMRHAQVLAQRSNPSPSPNPDPHPNPSPSPTPTPNPWPGALPSRPRLGTPS